MSPKPLPLARTAICVCSIETPRRRRPRTQMLRSTPCEASSGKRTQRVDGTVAIYSFQPVRCNASHANVSAVDTNLLATNVGLGAELVFPHTVADDDPSVQREVE